MKLDCEQLRKSSFSIQPYPLNVKKSFKTFKLEFYPFFLEARSENDFEYKFSPLVSTKVSLAWSGLLLPTVWHQVSDHDDDMTIEDGFNLKERTFFPLFSPFCLLLRCLILHISSSCVIIVLFGFICTLAFVSYTEREKKKSEIVIDILFEPPGLSACHSIQLYSLYCSVTKYLKRWKQTFLLYRETSLLHNVTTYTWMLNFTRKLTKRLPTAILALKILSNVRGCITARGNAFTVKCYLSKKGGGKCFTILPHSCHTVRVPYIIKGDTVNDLQIEEVYRCRYRYLINILFMLPVSALSFCSATPLPPSPPSWKKYNEESFYHASPPPPLS